MKFLMNVSANLRKKFRVRSDLGGEEAIGRLRRWNGVDLLEERELIPVVPGFCDLAVDDASDDDAGDFHARIARRHAQTFAEMGGFEDDADCDLFALRDGVFDGDMEVGERSAEIRQNTRKWSRPTTSLPASPSPWPITLSAESSSIALSEP